MARGRMIDQHYTRSKKLNSLTRDLRYIYAAILPYLDREGRIIAEPRHLDGTVFLKTDVRKDEIADALQEFAAVGLIELYADEDGMAILQYTRFSEFNTPNHREKASELPGPTGERVEVASGTSVNTPPGAARATDGLNVNGNVNDNENGNATSDTPTSEERMARAFDTGQPQANPVHRVRSELTHLVGSWFTQKYAGDMAAWSRWTNDDLRKRWEASDPDGWRGEEHKAREWIFADLLNEKRKMPVSLEPDNFKSFEDIMNEIRAQA